MVYLARKKIKGKNYYYVVESARNEKGQSRQKIIQYLGSEEKLLKRLGIKADS